MLPVRCSRARSPAERVIETACVRSGMPAMPVTRATISARVRSAGHIGWAMPSQDCLYIRLSDYFEARRHAPDRDHASKVLAVEKVAQSAGARRPEQEGGADDQGR